MTTTDPFWTACADAIAAHRLDRRQDALRLLDVAARALAAQPGSGGVAARRRQHLQTVRAHVTAAQRRTAAVPAATAPSTTAAALPAGVPPDALAALQRRIAELEQDKQQLSERVRQMPSLDPLLLIDAVARPEPEPAEPFGIILFGHTRHEELEAVLESLKRQDALRFTEVWLDGHQGKESIKLKLQKTVSLIKRYDVKRLHTQNGNYAFRKMMLLGLSEMSRTYRDILVLEDDCFPTRDAIAEFRRELDVVRDDPRIFSVYGHHFLVPSEGETCNRFQGWGWATTSRKLRPVLRQLIDCYSMTEDRYLEFVRLTLTDEMRARIDVTPPRQPSRTLERFFAWDETLCLLSALNGQVHKPTRKRTIFNCGMGKDSTHFAANDAFRKPPFNLITPDEVWQHF